MSRTRRHGDSAAPARHDLRPGPDQQSPVARPDPEPVHQADDGPRRHDARPVGTRHERDAVVRAGRRHDRAGPDLEMGIRRRSPLTSPSYQPIAATPVRTSTPAAASAAAASSSSVPIVIPDATLDSPASRAIAGLRLDDGRRAPRPRPHPARRGARRGRRRRRGRRCRCAVPAGRRGPASGPSRSRPRPPNSAARRDSACAAGAGAGIGGGRRSAGSSANTARPATAGRARPMASACSPRATRPSRTGTRHERTLGTPSTSHSHQPHCPVEHMSPRGRWKRKLRDRISRSAARRLRPRAARPRRPRSRARRT